MIRVGCYIDGFNIYHALDDLARLTDPAAHHLKWLDLRALCSLYTDPAAHQIVAVKYFSAFQNWQPERVARHKQYLQALRATGVDVVLGHFKEKQKYCKLCDGTFTGHEEKESDVNLATQMVADAHDNLFDAVYLMSRDSDLAPPLRYIRRRFPEKRIKVIAPQWRMHSKELLALSTHRALIRKDHVEACRLPGLIGGVPVPCPPRYSRSD